MTDSAERRRVLESHGASGAVIDELLAYNENNFDRDRFGALTLPLDDEPLVTAWRDYAADAEQSGTVAALSRRLVQLRFPIEAKISESEAYRAATRRGVFPMFGKPPVFVDRSSVRLRIHKTMAGSIPVVIARERADFETLVQAFSSRNEPEEVPQSMGACIVTGLNNWDRVDTYKRGWIQANPEAGDEGWKAEFARFAARKELYQDRFLILSSGSYSAVPHELTGYDDDEWRRLSVEIRLEHECTHYFTYRVLGSMRNNLLDEIIADYAGLVRAIGQYRRDLALLFFGLEEFPRYRAGARLENYRGSPQLSDAAFTVLQSLVTAVITNVAAFEARHPVDPDSPQQLAKRFVNLASSSLELLAAGPETLEKVLDA